MAKKCAKDEDFAKVSGGIVHQCPACGCRWLIAAFGYFSGSLQTAGGGLQYFVFCYNLADSNTFLSLRNTGVGNMKQNLINTAAGALAAALLLGAGAAWAQDLHPHTRAGIQTDADNAARARRGATQQPYNRGSSAAEVNEWHRRERQVQSEIAELRRTPFWMAIGWDPVSKGLLWPGGYRSEQRAIEAVRQNCRSSRCEILATFANSCAVLVTATDRPQSRRDLFIGIDRDDRRAAVKARQACTAVHGEDDRCFYSEIKTGKGVEGTAFCVGYDHSLYNQR